MEDIKVLYNDKNLCLPHKNTSKDIFLFCLNLCHVDNFLINWGDVNTKFTCRKFCLFTLIQQIQNLHHDIRTKFLLCRFYFTTNC